MKNWKTTVAGIATAACYIGYKVLTKIPINGEDITLALGMIGIGGLAADHSNVNPK